MSRWSLSTLIMVVVQSLIVSGTANAIGSTPTSEPQPSVREESPGPLLAQRKKKKKKRKKKISDESTTSDAGGESATGGTSVHAAQEGQDAPYSWEVSLLSDFSVTNRKTGEAKTGSADYNLATRGLYLITPMFAAGAGLEFDESSFKTEEDTSTSRRYILDLIGKINFGDINQDTMIFFTELFFGTGSQTSESGDVKTEVSITRYGLGAGLHWFVDSNVALTTDLTYEGGSEKDKDAEEPTSFSTIHLLRIGFSLFL